MSALSAMAQVVPIKRQSQAPGDLTTVFSHDLRSPLSAVSMNVDFALGELGDAPEAVVAALKDAQAAATRAFRLIASMLAVSRFDAGTLEPSLELLSPSAFVELAMSATMAEAESRHVRLACEGWAGPVSVDAELLAGALEELLARAVRAARKGGEVTVRISASESSVAIDVSPGVPLAPPETDPFERPIPGTRSRVNLGLYFCRVAVEAHGGSVVMVDPTTARVTLPCEPATPSAPRLRR